MNFCWSGLSTSDTSLGPEFPTSNLMIFEILHLGAALYLLENSTTPEKLSVNSSLKYSSELAYTSATGILDEIQTVSRNILKTLDTRSSSNLVRSLVLPVSPPMFTQQSPGNSNPGVIGT